MTEEKNNFDIPSYLNKEFFKKALENGLHEKNLNIESLNFTLGCSPGENYCSEIFRVQVVYTDNNGSSHKTSLIVKHLALEGELAALKERGIFEKERDVYDVIIPAMTKKLNGKALAPRCYYSQKEPVRVLVFADMSCLGFCNADRVQGLDEDHCALVFQKLGIFHGLSMELAQKDPTLLNQFKDGFDDEFVKTPFFKKGVCASLKHLAEVAAKWKGFEKISEKINKLCDNESDLENKCNIALAQRSDDVQVLTHNDLWTNNILFKYATDSKKLEDLVFVDFQVSCYISPGFDMTHFLYTSPYLELLENKRDFMIKEYYYKSLVSTLKEQNYSPIPSFDKILREIENREFSGLIWSVIKLPLICMEKELCGDNSIDNMVDENVGRKIREIGFSTERCQNIMKYILKRLDKIGVFD